MITEQALRTNHEFVTAFEKPRKRYGHGEMSDAAVRQPTGLSAPKPVPPPPGEVNAYRVHTWRDPQLELQMIANGFASIGGDEIADLTGVTDFDADLVTTLNGQHTVQEFKAAGVVRRLRSLGDAGVDPGSVDRDLE